MIIIIIWPPNLYLSHPSVVHTTYTPTLSIFLKGGCFHHFPFIKNLFDLRAYHCLKDKHTLAFEALQGCVFLIAFYFLPFTFYTCLAGLFNVS